MRGYTFEELLVGQKAAYNKQVTEALVRDFARLTGDNNPIHLDEEYAKETPFQGRIAHGMIAAGFISAAMVATIPGPGAIYLAQSLVFLKPVRIGDLLVVQLEVVGKNPAKGRIQIATTCVNQAGEAVVRGEATVLPSQVPLSL